MNKPAFGQTIVRTDPDDSVGGAWEIIGDTVVAVDGTTQVDFTGLDGNTDEQYKVFVSGLSDAGGAADIALRFNGDSGANYEQERVAADGALLTSSRSTVTYHVLTESRINEKHSAEAFISAKVIGGNRRTISQGGGTRTGGIALRIVSSDWLNTTDNIISISVLTAGAGWIAGTRITLMRVVR